MEQEHPLSWVAYADLRSIRYSHAASKTAVQLLASNEDLRPLIQAQFQMNSRFERTGDGSSYENAANRLIEVAQELVNSDFQVTRLSSQVSCCSAFEHLAKCIVVEWAELAPEKVHGLDNLRLTLQAIDVLESDLRDRLFLVADKIYQETSSNKGYLEKIRSIVSAHLPHQLSSFEPKLAAVNKLDYNEAFVVRNCLVHHGAKVHRQLSRYRGFELGKPITITAPMLGRYLDALEGMGDVLWGCAATVL